MITRIEVAGFRSFRDCAVDLSPFTVLVGQNGSGKTNLLEAVDLAAQLSGGSGANTWWSSREGVHWTADVRPGGERRGRIVDLFHRYGDGTATDLMSIVVCFLQSDSVHGMRHLRLDLDISREGASTRPRARGTVTLLPDAPARWGLTEEQQTQIWQNAESGPSFERSSPGGRWYGLAPQAGGARLDADLHDDERMARDAHNLSAVLGRLLGDTEASGQEALLLTADAVAVLPGLTDLRSTPDAERGAWELELTYRDAAPTPARLASDGTLHVLSVLTAAHDRGGPDPSVYVDHQGRTSNLCSTLMIEDVENGLHPGQVKELVRRLRRCTGPRTLQQIIVTTHSPVVLAAVYPAHPGDVLFADTVTRVGGGETPSRHTRIRPLAESGERGTYVPAREARQYLETAQAGSR
ncbi:AAA family ATPase [Streptomyces sp. NBC_01506]|uniref:AAA family ATPase n=1 Tax=Streptomyces sp. NBC_01506 TaxID=2903887 RepID=UPI00386D63C2